MPIRAIKFPISFQYQICLAGSKPLPPSRVIWNHSIASPIASVEKWSPGWVVFGWKNILAVPSSMEPYNCSITTSSVVPKTAFSLSELGTSPGTGVSHMRAENSSYLEKTTARFLGQSGVPSGAPNVPVDDPSRTNA